MEYLKRLFEGRIDRKEFIKWQIILMLIAFVWEFWLRISFYRFIQNFLMLTSGLILFIELITAIIFSIIDLSLVVKRLRDIGLSVWWVLIFLFPFVWILNLNSPIQLTFLVIIPLMIQIAFTLFLAIKKGKKAYR